MTTPHESTTRTQTVARGLTTALPPCSDFDACQQSFDQWFEVCASAIVNRLSGQWDDAQRARTELRG